MSYQKTKEFERLSFLYLITGNTDKLRKMLKIAEMRGDVMARFHNALFLGDAEERMRVLEATGQLSLAYLTAANHGLEADKVRLAELLTAAKLTVPAVSELLQDRPTLLQPPTPIFKGENWPLLAVGKSVLSDVRSSGKLYPLSWGLDHAISCHIYPRTIIHIFQIQFILKIFPLTQLSIYLCIYLL
jgi:coatomer protein complex subunit alpha (xenin)